MEGEQAGAGGAGGGGPAPFLLKTYEMVDDSSTDDIVSWSSTNASFVVWNPPDFAAHLLPTYFKHNNFSSFIRQLNTYGFRKIDPERWEFANEEFVKGQKHLLKNIHRRKPIHSHSHPPGAILDSERAALEEEIERLTREKSALHAELWRFKQQQSGTKIQLEDLERRLFDMEQRQLKMVAFLQRAIHNPKFLDNLVRMAGVGYEDFTVIHKKRRLPGLDYCQEVLENSFYDNHSSTSKPDIGQVFSRNFCDKLKLELCPAISESNLVSPSTQSSNEDAGCLHRSQPDLDRMECLSLVPESLELSDTGNSFCSRKTMLFSQTVDEEDGLALCHLNLTLASCSMQVDRSQRSDSSPNSGEQGVDDATELRAMDTGRKDELLGIVENNQSIAAESVVVNVQSLQGAAAPTGNQVPVAPPGRVNDVFWEQFLTERPGSSDTEEASSSLRANPLDEHPDGKKLTGDDIWRNKKDMEQLSL